MSGHTFRNPDKIQQLPFRDWLRTNMPNGKDGFVVEDLDLIIRVYGNNYKTDQGGKFFLIDLKHGTAWIDNAQKKTFGLMHELLRLADPKHLRYKGFFVVQYSNSDWGKSAFKVNKVSLDRNALLDFFSFRLEIDSLFD